jgi:hypothetical protein
MKNITKVNGSAFDPCVYCGESTAFGSGLFVNRVPGDHTTEDGEYRDGYWCVECLGGYECDRCGEETEFDTDTFIYARLDGEKDEIRVGTLCCFDETKDKVVN